MPSSIDIFSAVTFGRLSLLSESGWLAKPRHPFSRFAFSTEKED